MDGWSEQKQIQKKIKNGNALHMKKNKEKEKNIRNKKQKTNKQLALKRFSIIEKATIDN